MAAGQAVRQHPRLMIFLGSFLAALIGMNESHQTINMDHVRTCFGGPVVPPHNHFACYASMAAHPRHAVVAPYAFRVLSPFLVHLMPLDIERGFVLLAALSLAGASVLMFDMIAAHTDQLTAIGGLALMWTSGIVGTVLYLPALLDGQTCFLVCLVLWAVRRERWTLVGVAAVLIVCNNDIGLCIIPAALFAAAPNGRKAVLRVATPAAATYLVLHYTGIVYGHVVAPYPLLSSANAHMILDDVQFNYGSIPGALAYSVWTPFGAGWALTAVLWRRISPYWRSMFALTLVAAVPMFTVAADWGRVLLVPAVVAIPGICDALFRLRHGDEVPPAATVASSTSMMN